MHVILLLVSLFPHHKPLPVWEVQDESGIPTPSCPIGYTVYASEREALAGKPFVHCIKEAK